MPSLYQLTVDQLQMIREMEEAGFDQETIQDTLESNREEFEAKAIAITGHIKNTLADAEVFKNEAKRLQEEAKKLEAKAEYWTHYLDNNMKALGIKELKDGVHKLSYRKGSEVVEVADENIIPETITMLSGTYALRVPQPSKLIGKTELKKLIKENPKMVIPGVALVRKPDTLQVK